MSETLIVMLAGLCKAGEQGEDSEVLEDIKSRLGDSPTGSQESAIYRTVGLGKRFIGTQRETCEGLRTQARGEKP